MANDHPPLVEMSPTRMKALSPISPWAEGTHRPDCSLGAGAAGGFIA